MNTLPTEVLEALMPARRRLTAARVRVRGEDCAVGFVWFVAVGAVIELVGGIVAWLTPIEAALGFHIAAGAVVLAGAASLLVGITKACRQAPGWCEVAEHVDLAHDDHNRIASACYLRCEGRDSPFAVAAIEDGFARLRALREVTAARSKGRRPWKGLAAAASCAVVLAILAGAVRWLPAPGIGMRHPKLVVEGPTHAPGAVAWSEPKQREEETPTRPKAKPSPGQPRGTRSNAGERTSGTDVLAPPTPAESKPRGARSGTPSARSARRTRGAASGAGGAQSAGDAEERGGAPLTKRGAEHPRLEHSEATGRNTGGAGGAIPIGGAGSGRGVAMEHLGAQREAALTETVEAAEGDEPAEQATDGSRQRGGVRPSLPDRTQAPSRELGITGPQSGRPGTGRGGPSPMKKARGAAALLMGVPMPDFVKGRMQPGVTAVRRETTPPDESRAVTDGGGASGEGASRVQPENAVGRFEVPWSDASAALEYSRRWHNQSHTDQP
jgi:hypothetical protein